MNQQDHFNIGLVKENLAIDKINKEFYGKFNFPWAPLSFPSFEEDGLIKLLNQDLGYYDQPRLPADSKIWVAGCGTNQAIFTALKYPGCQITGTDISTESLETSQRIRDNLSITNLTFVEKSINDTDYQDSFDYIICTGVIHHNADPGFTLSKLAKALKPNGVLELMVYNYYHRLLTTATQKAVKALAGASADLRRQFQVARNLIDYYPHKNLMSNFLSYYKDVSDAELADALFQPVEYSYTVESLQELVESCNLEYLLPCMNQVDAIKDNYSWNIDFKNQDLDNYLSLADPDRWQIGNLLLLNESPMLWFYLQRKDASFKRMSEAEVCNLFLNTRFEKTRIKMSNFVLKPGKGYQAGSAPSIFPMPNRPRDRMSSLVYEAIDPGLSMKQILNNLQIDATFYNVNRIRINLTTLIYPYIQAVPAQ